MPVYPVSSEFGEIILNDGTKLEYDVLLIPPHTVLKRKKSLSKDQRTKYNHTPLTKKELEFYLNLIETQHLPFPVYFIIGTGHYGSLPITEDAISYLKSKNINILQERTLQAIQSFKKYLEQGKNIVGLFHVTC